MQEIMSLWIDFGRIGDEFATAVLLDKNSSCTTAAFMQSIAARTTIV